MDMGWMDIHGLGWVGVGQAQTFGCKVEAVELVRWGLRAGLL